jgi:uncharacterized protein (DUF1800 family)
MMSRVSRCLLGTLLAALLASCGGGSGEPDARRVPLAAGSAAAAEDREDLYRFFVIAFGAAPGTTYLAQLVQAVDAGMTIRQIVNVFTTKPQFLQFYPQALSPQEFAQKLVDNVVGDSAGPQARAQAVDEIVTALALPGWTRGDVVYALFHNLARKPPDDPLWAGTARKLAVQVAYARYFTETMKISSTEMAVLRSPLSSVTQSSPTAGELMLKSIQAASRSDVARFLGQAAFAANEAEIARVQALGYSGWIDEQVAQPGSISHTDWMIGNGHAITDNASNFRGVDNTLWRKLMSSPDVLRQRVALAYSELFVVSMSGLPVRWRGMMATAYMDLLTQGAFGNFRQLLQDITLSPAMGVYLNMRGNQKENSATGRQPDENYAREVLQLFSIGLHQLNLDGTPKAGPDGELLETYDNQDVAGLARVFTGWDYDNPDTLDHAYVRRPMAFFASRHSTAEKRFLGATIPAGSIDGPGDLKKALDTIFLHPNVGPFIGRQLIQRLVSSNPSPAYVARVAATFNDNGAGVRGDMRAVIKAILTDAEATSAAATAYGGRLVEPMVRLIAWARVFGVTTPSGAWSVGDLSDTVSRLGQSPLRSPSVFNFFRPGYVPPNTALGAAGLVAPELQITHESSVIGYANYMQGVIQSGIGDIDADYSSLKAVATDATALVDKAGLWFAAGRLSASTRQEIVTAVASMPANTDAARANRIYATVLLVMTCPEYLVQK